MSSEPIRERGPIRSELVSPKAVLGKALDTLFEVGICGIEQITSPRPAPTPAVTFNFDMEVRPIDEAAKSSFAQELQHVRTQVEFGTKSQPKNHFLQRAAEIVLEVTPADIDIFELSAQAQSTDASELLTVFTKLHYAIDKLQGIVKGHADAEESAACILEAANWLALAKKCYAAEDDTPDPRIELKMATDSFIEAISKLPQDMRNWLAIVQMMKLSLDV